MQWLRRICMPGMHAVQRNAMALMLYREEFNGWMRRARTRLNPPSIQLRDAPLVITFYHVFSNIFVSAAKKPRTAVCALEIAAKGQRLVVSHKKSAICIRTHACSQALPPLAIGSTSHLYRRLPSLLGAMRHRALGPREVTAIRRDFQAKKTHIPM